MSEKMVYVVTMAGIGDAGCIGVFTKKRKAVGAAELAYKHSDGYHQFRINEFPLDWRLPWDELPMNLSFWKEGEPKTHERPYGEGVKEPVKLVTWAEYQKDGND